MKALHFLASVAAVSSALPVYIYSDEWNNNTPVGTVLKKYVEAGATHLVLAFHLMNGQWDNDVADTVKWLYDMPEAERTQLLKELRDMGAEIILSTGGASAGSTWFHNFTPAEYSAEACGLAAKWGLDGVDFDLEELPAYFGSSSQSSWVTWCKEAIVECKKHFNGYVTAAPQSPYQVTSFSGPAGFDTFGYDKLLIQYYNQGGWFQEMTKAGLFGDVEGSVKDLMQRHPEAPADSFVVGKPMVEGEDGTGGDMTIEELHEWGCEAFQNYGWRGGFMFWRGHHDRESEMAKISKIAEPCPGEDSIVTTPKPAPTTASATTIASTVPVTTTTSTTTAAATSVFSTGKDSAGGCNPMAEECAKAIKAFDSYWIETCQLMCYYYGPGGCFNDRCSSAETTEDLIKCISQQYTFCNL